MNLPTVKYLYLCLAVCLSAAAHADELVIGVEDLPYMPYYSVDGGEYNGFARELFDAFGAERGYRIRYRPLPVERLYRALFDGTIDLKFPDSPEWRGDLKASRTLHYSRAVVPFEDAVMVLGGSPSHPKGTLSIGTIRGFTPWPLLPDIKRGHIRLSENNSISGLLRQVISGRLDGAYINVAVAQFQLSNVLRRDAMLVRDDAMPHTLAAYYLSSTRRPGVIGEFNAWLRDNSDRVARMQAKWGIQP